MTVVFSEAERADIPAVIALLEDDALGHAREGADIAAYEAAFDDMGREGRNWLIVGEMAGRVVATYQLTLISGLSLRASRRAQIESVRVASDLRGSGIGAAMLADAEARARAGGASLMQLTANTSRDRAHAFYRRQGFIATHVGFKKEL